MPPARGVATAQGERLMAPERVCTAKPKQLRPGSERIGGNFHSMVQPCLKANGWVYPAHFFSVATVSLPSFQAAVYFWG